KQELMIVPNVIIRIIVVGGKHEQRGIRGMLVFRGPDHGRHIYAKVRAVESELLSLLSVVHHYGTGASHADQKLLTLTMSMLATNAGVRHFKGHKVTLRNEGQRLLEFAHSQITSRIADVGEDIGPHTRDLGLDEFNLVPGAIGTFHCLCRS